VSKADTAGVFVLVKKSYDRDNKFMKTFSEKVLGIVRAIPRGSVLSYQEVARKAGNPRASRAVGSIMKKNFRSDIPCHRVIRSDGSLGEYNRGAGEKRRKLREEGYVV